MCCSAGGHHPTGPTTATDPPHTLTTLTYLEDAIALHLIPRLVLCGRGRGAAGRLVGHGWLGLGRAALLLQQPPPPAVLPAMLPLLLQRALPGAAAPSQSLATAAASSLVLLYGPATPYTYTYACSSSVQGQRLNAMHEVVRLPLPLQERPGGGRPLPLRQLRRAVGDAHLRGRVCVRACGWVGVHVCLCASV